MATYTHEQHNIDEAFGNKVMRYSAIPFALTTLGTAAYASLSEEAPLLDELLVTDAGLLAILLSGLAWNIIATAKCNKAREAANA